MDAKNNNVKAETQVVAGVNYKIEFIINEINSENNTNFYCNILAYERTWENYLNLDKFEIKKDEENIEQ